MTVSLRHIVCGMGGKASGVPREDGFDITVASEIMAVLCLASGLSDLKQRYPRWLWPIPATISRSLPMT